MLPPVRRFWGRLPFGASLSSLATAPAGHTRDFSPPLLLIDSACFGGKPIENFHNLIVRAFNQVVGKGTDCLSNLWRPGHFSINIFPFICVLPCLSQAKRSILSLAIWSRYCMIVTSLSQCKFTDGSSTNASMLNLYWPGWIGGPP